MMLPVYIIVCPWKNGTPSIRVFAPLDPHQVAGLALCVPCDPVTLQQLRDVPEAPAAYGSRPTVVVNPLRMVNLQSCLAFGHRWLGRESELSAEPPPIDLRGVPARRSRLRVSLTLFPVLQAFGRVVARI